MNSPILSQGALEIYLKSGMFVKHKQMICRFYSERMKVLLDTGTCFLKEYRTNRCIRISISKTDGEKIRKGIPEVFRAVTMNLRDKNDRTDDFLQI